MRPCRSVESQSLRGDSAVAATATGTLVQAELQKEVAKEKAMAEGRARALEHRENRDIFMEEIGAKAREWGKQYMLLLQEAFQNLGSGAQLLLTTEYGPQALYGAAGLFAAYYGIRGGVGLGFRCASRAPPIRACHSARTGSKPVVAAHPGRHAGTARQC